MEEREKRNKIKAYWRIMAISTQSKDLYTIRRTLHALHALGVSWAEKPLPDIQTEDLPLEYDPLIDDTTEESTIIS